ncbi:GH25 family lysozyme [Diplocloster hominis]|uniref:GH25 family lysozyme n=1 Tax=Diplocloster hominis TaxID=3079010 RepID=UPI0031BABEB1
MYLGVDLSYHNRYVDFSQLKEAGIEYVILRAGYGQNNIDKAFDRYAQACIDHGIQFGAYWFGYPLDIEMARQEARCAIEAVGKYRSCCPIAYDLEYDSVQYAAKKGVRIDRGKATEMARVFCEEVASAGYIPVLYSNKDYLKNYFDLERIDAYLWYARYTSRLSDSEKRSCAIWQKSSSGKVPGISGRVDINEFYVDFEFMVENPEPTQSGRPEVKALQNALNLDGYRDDDGKPLEEDGKVGPKTRAALRKVVLRRGSSGVMVDWAQKRLNELSGAGLEEDGEYGPATENEVKKRQRTAGLKADGLCGPKTITNLL